MNVSYTPNNEKQVLINVQLVTPKTNPFSDVSMEDWFSGYVTTAKNIGILEETGKIYGPAALITRGGISENIYRLALYLTTLGE